MIRLWWFLSRLDGGVHYMVTHTIGYRARNPPMALLGFARGLYNLFRRTYPTYEGTLTEFWGTTEHLKQLIITRKDRDWTDEFVSSAAAQCPDTPMDEGTRS